jgi:hypothetical protein
VQQPTTPGAHDSADSSSTNSAMAFGGTGQALVTLNRISVEGDDDLATAHIGDFTGSMRVTLTGNFFWFKAAVGSGSAGIYDSWRNAGFFLYNQGGAEFVANTLLGNDVAFSTSANNQFSAFLFFSDSSNSSIPPSTGTSFVTNNVIQDFRTVLMGAGSAAKIVFTSNSVNDVNVYANSSTDPASLDSAVDDGTVGAGSANNLAEDCSLKDAFHGDWHLGAGSTCAGTGAADPLNPTTDLDGDARPLPAGTLIDRGADEVSQ